MRYFLLIFKGMIYGVTHVAPGLGGGVVLILLGIYEEFVEALGNLMLKRQFLGRYLRFLVPLGIGMVLGLVVAAIVIEGLLERYPAQSMFFFMGLLLGTIPSVWRIHEDMRPTVGRVGAFLFGLALVVLLRGGGERLLGERSAFTLESGREIAYNLGISFLAGGASVTPGLDGSYILLLGGTYAAVLSAVASLRHFVIQWGALLSTGIGALLGIMTFSKLIDLAIKRAPSLAYYGVLGLVIGSIYGLWPHNDLSQVSSVGLALCTMAGIGIALLLGKIGQETTPEPAVAVSETQETYSEEL